MRQLSACPPLGGSFGVLAHFAFFLPNATISCTCSSPNPSSSTHPSPVTTLPCTSLPNRCTPLPSTHCTHIVGSRVSRSAAKILSPAASCTLTCRSAQRMRTTMSKLMSRVRATPFSTAKVCSSVPRHQRESSAQKRMSAIKDMATVHLPPPEVRVVYWDLVLARAYAG